MRREEHVERNRQKRHAQGAQLDACATLEGLRIARGQDFHALSRAQVEGLLEAADRVRYQKPSFANGSRARYFHERLQRQARGKMC